MKHLIFSIVLIGFVQLVFASGCKEISTNEWICRDIKGTVTRIVYSKNTYWFKTYFPEEKGSQTEATLVSKSTPAEFENRYKTNCFVFLFRYLPDMNRAEREQHCDELWNAFDNGSDNQSVIDESLLMLSDITVGATSLHIVLCMDPDYVRTYDYDSYTQLEIHRQDYMGLRYGSYCSEFMRTNKIKWLPNN